MVTVQDSLFAKSASGSSVNVVGPPPTTAVCAPLVPQEIPNQEPLTSTASLKVTSMFAAAATLVAPLAGVVPVTIGAASLAPNDWPVFGLPNVLAVVAVHVKSP